MISMSARSDVLFVYVERFTTFTLSLLVSFLSDTLDHKIGCISAILAPHVTIVSVSSMSSKQPAGSSIPNVCIKPATAEAIQCLAFGSRLFDLNPAFISFRAAYPSWIVY